MLETTNKWVSWLIIRPEPQIIMDIYTNLELGEAQHVTILWNHGSKANTTSKQPCEPLCSEGGYHLQVGLPVDSPRLDWRKSSGTFPDFSVIFTFSAGDTGTMAPFILEGSTHDLDHLFAAKIRAGGLNTHLINPYKTHKQYIHIYVLYVEKVQISGWKVGHTYMYCIYLDPQSTPRNVINSKLV